jgi:hypothetical protein
MTASPAGWQRTGLWNTGGGTHKAMSVDFEVLASRPQLHPANVQGKRIGALS